MKTLQTHFTVRTVDCGPLFGMYRLSYPYSWLLLCFWSLCCCQQESLPLFHTHVSRHLSVFIFTQWSAGLSEDDKLKQCSWSRKNCLLQRFRKLLDPNKVELWRSGVFSMSNTVETLLHLKLQNWLANNGFACLGALFFTLLKFWSKRLFAYCEKKNPSAV